MIVHGDRIYAYRRPSCRDVVAEGLGDAALPVEGKTDSGWSVFKDVGGALTVGAVVLYALAYFIQYVFYEQFGVTPDEVGVDKVAALLRLVPLILLAGTVGTVGAFVLIFVAGLLAGFIPERIRDRLNLPLYFAAFAVGAAIAYQALVVDGAHGSAHTQASVYMSAVWALVTWSWISVLMWFVVERYATRRAAALATAITLIVVVTFTMMSWVSDAAARLHQTGVAAQRLAWIGIPIGYVDVHWIDAARRPSSIVETTDAGLRYPARLLILLNQTTSNYTFYDCHTEHAYIVSASDVVVDPAISPVGQVTAVDWLHQAAGCAA